MSAKSQFLTHQILRGLRCHCFVVIGDPQACWELVSTEFNILAVKHGHVIEVPSMPPLEEILRYQEDHTVIRNGVEDKPSFIRSFLGANNFDKMPLMLVFNGFNRVPSQQTDFLRPLLDKALREDDECYQMLKTVVLLMTPMDEEGSHPINPYVETFISFALGPDEEYA